jgi:deoxycytidine triphosphate deaminase
MEVITMPFFMKKILNSILLFFIRGTLSDIDIQKLLGTHIFIYPFKKENLKGASYNLTASRFAFIFAKDKNEKHKKELLIVDDKDNINIPEGATAIIQTNESIYVSNNIAGTYHSRVKMVNRGLGHIGTTLDPRYFGPSAIALHNTSKEIITIKVNEPIVSIMFCTLRSKSSGEHDNLPGRQDVLSLNIGVDDFYEEDLKEDKDSPIYSIIKGKLSDKKDIDKDFIDNNLLDEIDLSNFKCDEHDSSNLCTKCQLILSKKFEKDNKRKEIIKEINDWRKQPWINSQDNLIKYVVNYVRMRDLRKNIVMSSVFCIIIGVIFIVTFIYNIKNGNEDFRDVYKILIGATPPTIGIIIGVIVRYQKDFINIDKE